MIFILYGFALSDARLSAVLAASGKLCTLGAKLTGGGLGGCTIALADGPRAADRIRAELERAGAAAT